MNITGTIFDSYFKNSTLEVSGKNGTRIYSLGVAPAGYKLLNPEVLVEYFTMDGNAAFINGKDVDLTLKYAPISQVLIRYVDRDTGQVISSSLFNSNSSSSASYLYNNGDKFDIAPSKFKAVAIDIPGYKLVSEPTQVQVISNIKENGKSNYQIFTFYYQKVMTNDSPKATNPYGPSYGEFFSSNGQWSTIDAKDIFTTSGVKGNTYEHDHGDLQAKYQHLIDKYTKQGYTYVGTGNWHANDDYYNWNETSTNVNLVPNKNVTVRYVDQAGND